MANRDDTPEQVRSRSGRIRAGILATVILPACPDLVPTAPRDFVAFALAERVSRAVMAAGACVAEGLVPMVPTRLG